MHSAERCQTSKRARFALDYAILRDGRVSLRRPLAGFFTATPRGGSAPSATLDALGDLDGAMRYARIRLTG